MGELLAYSGVTTKLRAIESRLFTREEYLELADAGSVTEAVNYIRQHPGYQLAFSKYEGADLHRGQIEGILDQMAAIDFQKIYRFCSVKQRGFLDMYFQKYEVNVLKKCLEMIFDHRDISIDLSYFQEFFAQHSRLDLSRLEECKTVDMLLAAVENTRYHSCIAKVQERGGSTMWDYGMALDYEFFLNFWKMRKKYLKGQALEIITEIYGVKMELLDINWIVRGKKYFNMSYHQLYVNMLPVGTHLKKTELKAMLEAGTMEEVQRVLSGSYYGHHYPELNAEQLESLYGRIRSELQHRLARKEPYSIAAIVSYIFDKEREIDRITSILECVRYGADAQALLRI